VSEPLQIHEMELDMRLVADPSLLPEPELGTRESGKSSGIRGIVQRVLGMLDTIVGGTVTVALLTLIVIIFANVIGRYGFNNSITWAAEAAQWLFVIVIFLAVPLAHRTRMHLSIGLLVDLLPPRAKVVAELLSDIIIAYTTIMLLFGGWTIIQMVGGVNYALGLPSWVKFSLIPIACGLGLFYLALGGIY
jgi:TRAP-type C4-dicarboxylate transport system permease small subunit